MNFNSMKKKTIWKIRSICFASDQACLECK